MIVKYLSEKIINGELDYDFVINKRPDLKTLIDEYLTSCNFKNKGEQL